MGVMYLHARMFCTPVDTTSIPMGAMYLLIPIASTNFTVITEVWPLADRAVVTNNSTVILEVVLIEAVLIEGFLKTVNLNLWKISLHKYIWDTILC